MADTLIKQFSAFLTYQMFKNLAISFIHFGIIALCTTVFADQEEIDTVTVSDDLQLIVSPINLLLDLSETGYADAFVINTNGTPIEGTEDESGISSFTILGKQEGNCIVTVSNGKVSSQINSYNAGKELWLVWIFQ
ncbi:MAG: hypothetical protein MRK01_15455 [Candidatus Scalindua sp.]|nr:hypothetical protein [Candidatus Scalindua sp.]